MKKTYSLTDFNQGINQLNADGAYNMANLDLAADGSLNTRYGYIDSDTLPDSNVYRQVFFAGSKMFVQHSTGLLYKTDSNTFAAVTDSTGLASSNFSAKFHVIEANRQRTFLANGDCQIWLDTAAARIYKWGIDAPALADFSFDLEPFTPVTSNTGGGAYTGVTNYGIQEGRYGYAFSFEGDYGQTSPLSTRTVVHFGPDQGTAFIRWHGTESALDAQITDWTIWRTEKATLGDAAGYEEALAMESPLFKVNTFARSQLSSVIQDSQTARGLAPTSKILDGAEKPPADLDRITLYAGRIWGSQRGDAGTFTNNRDLLSFSALDDSGAPLYDIFPGSSAPIPHQIRVREEVEGISASRNYLAVFGKSSTTLGRGQGLISGLYQLQLPKTDLDFSQYIEAIGSQEHCHCESNGNIYFYSPYDRRVYRIDTEGGLTWISQGIQDSLDTIDSSNITQVFAAKGKVYLAYRASGQSDLYVYDEFRNVWVRYDLGTSANASDFTFCRDVATGNSLISHSIYGLRLADSPESDSVMRMFDTDISQDRGNAIGNEYQTNEFVFAKPTRLDQIRVGLDAASDVIFQVDVDGAALEVPTPFSGTTHNLNPNNNYSVKLFARGNRFKVKFRVVGSKTVRYFEVQFRGQ